MPNDNRPPALRPLRLLLALLVSSASILLAAAILPGFDVGDFWVAVFAALVIGALNAVLAPLVAALRLPFTVATSFLLVLALDAGSAPRRRRSSRTRSRSTGSGGRSSPRS